MELETHFSSEEACRAYLAADGFPRYRMDIPRTSGTAFKRLAAGA
jgi:hypothetical protein